MRFLQHIWHDLRTDAPSRWLSLAGLGVNLGHWALFAAVVPRGDQFLPLHYTIYFGIDLTDHWTRAFIMPALGTVILIVHAICSSVVRDETWRRAWWAIAAVSNVLLLLGGFAVAWAMQNTV